MTHLTHKGYFERRAAIRSTAHTIDHADTHVLMVSPNVINNVANQQVTALARALARFSYAYYVRGSSSLNPLNESTVPCQKY